MFDKEFTLLGYDFHYKLDVDYTHSYPGYGGCICPENDYCRCQVINKDDVKIDFTSLTPDIILNLFIYNEVAYERERKINETLNESDAILYGIGRILSINNLYKKESYDIEITPGYYGEEFESLCIKDSIASKVTEQIINYLQLNTLKDKMEYLLRLEYGHLTEHVTSKEWKIIEVDKDDIFIPNEKHFKSVPHLDFYSDENYKEPRCVLRETGNKKGKKYKLVDGYHRLKTTNNKTVKSILAY